MATLLQAFTPILKTFIAVTIPTTAWYGWANNDRATFQANVTSDTKLKNSLVTVDDLTSMNVQPGDLLLFKRSPLHCASSPISALACMLQQTISSQNSYDHSAIIVPNPSGRAGDTPFVLEATASHGYISRPFIERIEMSRAKSILLLPLNSPGERREGGEVTQTDQPETASTSRELAVESNRKHIDESLMKFSVYVQEQSTMQNYVSIHSTLTLFGALASTFGVRGGTKFYPAPINPAHWLTTRALLSAGVAASSEGEGMGLNADCSMLIRKSFGGEVGGERAIVLRPGFRYGKGFGIRDR